MGADCKSVDLVCVGSNPTRPSFMRTFNKRRDLNLYLSLSTLLHVSFLFYFKIGNVSIVFFTIIKSD
jgi:hypothetical protein